MSNQGASPAPQWASDPSGRHRYRYWDGEQWTGHVSDGEVPPRAAPVAFVESPAEPPPAVHEHQGEYGATPVVASPALSDEDRTRDGEVGGRRGRHRPERSSRSFWSGALVGVLAAGALAGVAWVTIGGSSSTTKVVTRTIPSTGAQTSTTFGLTSTTLSASGSSTTLAGGTARPPAQVHVEVLNASGTAGAAGTKAKTLKNAGYVIAGTGNAALRQGTVVACKTGFAAEATALAQATGQGATTEPFPTPAPTGSANADCVIILGK